MNLTPVAALLERRIGLDPASLGASVLPAAVADRMRALGLADPNAYAGRLAEQPGEFAVLVERLVVPETWFFRGAGLFDELARHVARFAAGRPFRALSVPCSSGEEPYSLVLALLDAGVPPERWSVEGLDLSPRLIDAARRGVYREFSFRQTEPNLRDRYFRPTADGWELAERVRGLVRFDAGNLADPAFLSGASGAYDLILCRNLLIYLTPAARRQALETLERLLAPGGLLAVGHAEPQALAGRPFRRAAAEPLFLFRFEPSSTPDAPRRFPAVPPPAPLRERGGAVSTTPSPTPSPPAPRPRLGGEAGIIKTDEPLARARTLADAGWLDDALAEVARAGPSADAFSLLGVIQQARGDRAAAVVAFRKALYLDPGHREALTHAMLLSDQQGDAGRATVLRERLARTGGEP
jgi:chemotaxis protein methyltransferase WspC